MSVDYFDTEADRLDKLFILLPELNAFDLGPDPQATLRNHRGRPDSITDEIRALLDHFASLPPQTFSDTYAHWWHRRRKHGGHPFNPR